MFEELQMGAYGRGRSIELQTRLGNSIANSIAIDPVPNHATEKFDRLVARHTNWTVRKPATGIYNCFGHVWAARRTAVYDEFDAAVLKVRNDDRYRIVDLSQEEPNTGDIVCYWESIFPYSGCTHVARVVELKPRNRLPSAIFALSKWDDVSGEVIHQVDDVPFPLHQIEYWTDRPNSPYRRRIIS